MRLICNYDFVVYIESVRKEKYAYDPQDTRKSYKGEMRKTTCSVTSRDKELMYAGKSLFMKCNGATSTEGGVDDMKGWQPRRGYKILTDRVYVRSIKAQDPQTSIQQNYLTKQVFINGCCCHLRPAAGVRHDDRDDCFLRFDVKC